MSSEFTPAFFAETIINELGDRMSETGDKLSPSNSVWLFHRITEGIDDYGRACVEEENERLSAELRRMTVNDPQWHHVDTPAPDPAPPWRCNR